MFNTVFNAWSSFAVGLWGVVTARAPSRGESHPASTRRGARSPLSLVHSRRCARPPDAGALAEEHGCLVLYPEQSPSAHWNRCWNWYDQAHHRRGEGEPALIAGLTRRIMADHAVDATRVAVAGLSSGGAMAVILGRTYPDLFSAVGCHSGLAHGSATSSAGAIQAMRDGPDYPATPGRPRAVPIWYGRNGAFQVPGVQYR